MMLTLHPVENLGITSQLPPTSISIFSHPQVQPTTDCLVPQDIFSGKNFMCKGTHAVQIRGVQESTAVTIFFPYGKNFYPLNHFQIWNTVLTIATMPYITFYIFFTCLFHMK